MAVHLETEDQLKELKLILQKGGARALKMLKHVEFELKTELGGQEFIANKWPDPTIVLQKTTKLPLCSFVAGSCLVYVTPDTPIQELRELFELDIFDWNQPWTFAGQAADLYDTLTEIALEKGAKFEPRDKTIVANTLELKHSVEERPLPDGYYFSGPIQTEIDRKKVNSSWKFGGSDSSLQFIQLNIDKMRSCGVKDKEDNLVAFELQTCYGSVAMLHVDPDHRGKGIAKCVMARLANILHKEGQHVFCHIEHGNEMSLKLHTGFGYEILEGGEVFWTESYPKGYSSVKRKVCCT